jgi:cellulose synthase/poly-beta-1,6-N-acetylglucosamine synthase-like glycosyltransferase
MACLVLMIYGINCHIMIHLFKRRFKSRKQEDLMILQRFNLEHITHDLPYVTTQIPIYNEMNVAERIINAAAAFDYPRDRHEIQVLDDSTDETSLLIARRVQDLREQGICIEHIRRPDRQGFKAGALRYGLERARGELMAVFDADFEPPPDFLQRSIPYFVNDQTLGLVQARWGHLNEDKSLLTEVQSVGINGHFMVEQAARNWNDLLMNFNGTAGILKKEAILAAGNWHDDTLTEDMDLSYRMQLAGWKCRYLVDLVAPAEVPENINAFKSQQFRWAKGSIQTAMKLLPAVWRSDFSLFCKVQATFHMTHYIIHPLMAYLAIMAPILLFKTDFRFPTAVLIVFAIVLVLASTGPSRQYYVAEKHASRRWLRKMFLLPVMIAFGCGLAINNSRAVLEALIGKKSDFVRTPKQGGTTKKQYKASIHPVFVFEILIGLWCLAGIIAYRDSGQHVLRPFLFLYAIGFIYVGLLSFLHRKR